MKKTILIMLSLIIACTTVACSKSDTTNDNANNTLNKATEVATQSTTEATQPVINNIRFEKKQLRTIHFLIVLLLGIFIGTSVMYFGVKPLGNACICLGISNPSWD